MTKVIVLNYKTEEVTIVTISNDLIDQYNNNSLKTKRLVGLSYVKKLRQKKTSKQKLLWRQLKR